MKNHKVIVVGGGAAGLQAAATLRDLGVEPLIIEREMQTGGKVRRWHRLFPDFTSAAEVLAALEKNTENIETLRGIAVDSVDETGVTLAGGRHIKADAVIVATGFDLFRAELKEEYGYGIYDNVYTSADIEDMLNGDGVRLKDGSAPERIAILHCVGSRDEKVGQPHCSRLCCVTAVKQAMELREAFPDAEIYNYYMDIRMFGAGYEEMYRRAQERDGVRFVRGRISEAGETIDGRVQIKAEDTLLGRPVKMTVDMLVLAVGMTAAGSNRRLGVGLQESGFIAPRDLFTGAVYSPDAENIFYAGCATAPKNIGETLNEAAAAAVKAAEFVKGR